MVVVTKVNRHEREIRHIVGFGYKGHPPRPHELANKIPCHGLKLEPMQVNACKCSNERSHRL